MTTLRSPFVEASPGRERWFLPGGLPGHALRDLGGLQCLTAPQLLRQRPFDCRSQALTTHPK